MQTVTLYSEDFRTVHNTLCELRSLQERVTGVISTELATKLHAIVQGFEAGLKNAYAQDEAEFDRRMDHYSDFKQANQLRTIWSMFEVGDLNEPHPYGQIRSIVYKDHWGPEAVEAAVEGTTWGDLYRAADQAIRSSGDDHHIFIESFQFVKSDQMRLTTGS